MVFGTTFAELQYNPGFREWLVAGNFPGRFAGLDRKGKQAEKPGQGHVLFEIHHPDYSRHRAKREY